MKAKLEFDLPEEREEHEDALNGTKYKLQLEDIWNKMFRPRHKHGYDDQQINDIVQRPEGEKLMDYLEEIYKEIID